MGFTSRETHSAANQQKDKIMRMHSDANENRRIRIASLIILQKGAEQQRRKDMATPLGKALRKMRIDRDELLKDMAGKLDMSSSMLSSIENGTRKAPNGFMERIENAYALTDEEKDDIGAALSDEWGEVRIPVDDVDADDKEFALTFARSYRKVSEEDKRRILDILRKGE